MLLVLPVMAHAKDGQASLNETLSEDLNSYVPASDASGRIRRSFEEALTYARLPLAEVQLLITEDPRTLAKSLPHTVIVNKRVAELPESVRAFVISHEIGHLKAGFW